MLLFACFSHEMWVLLHCWLRRLGGPSRLASPLHIGSIPLLTDPNRTVMGPSPDTMASKECVSCHKSWPLDYFHPTIKGLTACCIPCLDIRKACSAEQWAKSLTKTVKRLLTLDSFYSALEAAKEEEPLTHTIPFYSKNQSDSNGVYTIQLASLGNNGVLDMDPATKKGIATFQTYAERIHHNCSTP